MDKPVSRSYRSLRDIASTTRTTAQALIFGGPGARLMLGLDVNVSYLATLADSVAQFLVDVTRKTPRCVVARRLHAAPCDDQRSAWYRRGRTRGTGALPVTLYCEQWVRLLDRAQELREFIEENKSKLKLKK